MPNALIADRRTWVILGGHIGVMLLLVGGLFPGAPSSSDLTDRSQDFLSRRAIVRWQSMSAGIAYGVLSASVWVSSLMTRKTLRWMCVAAWLIVLTTALSIRHDYPVARYLSMFGGLVVMQSLLFWLLWIPKWRCPKQSGQPSESTQQYSLTDLIAATTATALVLAMARVYRPSLIFDPAQIGPARQAATVSIEARYWLGVLTIWCWLPALSTCLAIIVTAAGKSAMLIAGILGLSIALSGTLILSRSEILARGDALPHSHWSSLGDDALFTLLYVVAFATIAFAGRLDAIVASTTELS